MLRPKDVARLQRSNSCYSRSQSSSVLNAGARPPCLLFLAGSRSLLDIAFRRRHQLIARRPLLASKRPSKECLQRPCRLTHRAVASLFAGLALRNPASDALRHQDAGVSARSNSRGAGLACPSATVPGKDDASSRLPRRWSATQLPSGVLLRDEIRSCNPSVGKVLSREWFSEGAPVTQLVRWEYSSSRTARLVLLLHWFVAPIPLMIGPLERLLRADWSPGRALSTRLKCSSARRSETWSIEDSVTLRSAWLECRSCLRVQMKSFLPFFL